MAKYDEKDGVWRTIGGRRVFIRDGESLSSAMKRSGKFKTQKETKLSKKQIDEGNRLTTKAENGVREDIKTFLSGKEDYDGSREDFIKDLSNEWGVDKDKVEDIFHEENLKHPRNFTGKNYDKKEDHTFKMNDEEKRKYEQVGKKMDNLSKELEEDLKDLKKHYREKENNKNIETISKEEYDKLPKDYKGTLKELINTAEFRGENKEELEKYYKDKGFDIENDKTIVKMTEKGATLIPVKVEDDNEAKEKIENSIKEDETKGKYSIEYFKNKGVEIKDEVPDGYIKLEDAATAPKGYEWYSNGKSRFGGEYKNALVKEQGEKGLSSRYAGTIEYLKSETNLTSSQIMELLKKIEKDAKK